MARRLRIVAVVLVAVAVALLLVSVYALAGLVGLVIAVGVACAAGGAVAMVWADSLDTPVSERVVDPVVAEIAERRGATYQPGKRPA